MDGDEASDENNEQANKKGDADGLDGSF